jgi:DNA-binding winged helix-turn-helix (wHTH) protein
MEYELLKFLAQHPGKVFTREILLSRVWGYEYYGGARTVDVHIRRLRAKLGEEHANLIQTVRAVGYRFGQSRWSVSGNSTERAAGREIAPTGAWVRQDERMRSKLRNLLRVERQKATILTLSNDIPDGHIRDIDSDRSRSNRSGR